MLVEEFMLARLRRHVFQHHAVLLQHIPVQALEPRPVEELPGVALPAAHLADAPEEHPRSEEHTSELQSLMRISYAVFCLKKKTQHKQNTTTTKHYTNNTYHLPNQH